MLLLLKKEFRLAMHPATPMMVLLGAMVLIPNYPYTVACFYVTMAIFFTCLLGRENNDIGYCVNLPVKKGDIVRARMLYAVIIEGVQLMVMIPLAYLSKSINPMGNAAGMDANITLFAEALLVYGVFNAVFFTMYYKDVSKVGVSFVLSSAAVFVLVVLDVAATYAIPFVRDVLDTPDPLYVTQKLIALAIGAMVYGVLTWVTMRVSIANFEKQDLR